MCVHDLSAAHAFAMTWGLVWSLLHVLLLLLDLLWRGWVTGFSFFISCFLPGLGLAWAWAFPSSIQPLPSLWVGWHLCCHVARYFCHVFIWHVLAGPLLGLLYIFLLLSSSSPILSLGLYSHCFGLPWSISSLWKLPWPILFLWASSARFISSGIPGPFQSFIPMDFC